MNRNSMTKTEQCRPVASKAQDFEKVTVPAVDIYEAGDTMTLVADLPGVQEQDLEITINKDILTIEAHGAKYPEGRSGAKEFHYGRYRRQFRLTEAVDSGKVSAELTRGVLTLTLPKVAAAVPRRVEVKTVH